MRAWSAWLLGKTVTIASRKKEAIFIWEDLLQRRMEGDVGNASLDARYLYILKIGGKKKLCVDILRLDACSDRPRFFYT
jgi:hypothetical protein